MSSPRAAPSLALAAYAETWISGAKVIVLGDARSPLAERLVERGARLVQVYDRDAARVAEASALSRSRQISFSSLDGAGSAARDGVFDFGMFGDVSLAPAGDAKAAEIGRDLVEMMVGAYLGGTRSDALLRDPRVSPIHAAAKLPPCHVVVGSADPLATQSEALVKALAQAGVPHEHFVDADMPHGYAQMEFLPGARPALDRMLAFLRRTV